MNPNDNALKTDVNIAELIAFLQGLDLEDVELSELVTSLTSVGLTETTRRKVRTVLMRVVNQDLSDLERYEKALDIVNERDTEVEAIIHNGEQQLNRIDMKAKAELDKIERDVNEDTEAAKGGATLLLHTEDVVIDEKSMDTIVSTISPKEAVGAVVAAGKVPASVLPISASLVPNGLNVLADSSLPATLASLPSTAIAPPAVTNPGA